MNDPVPQHDCLCAGIIVADFVCAPVDCIPAAGSLVMTDAISLAIGGCASNVAVDLARIGRMPAVVGCVGADMPGRFVADELARAGVDTAQLIESPGIQTSSTLVINVRGEDRRFIHATGANGAFTGADITSELVRRARVLYLGGFFLMPRLTADRVAELFRAARTAGVRTVLDVVIPDTSDRREDLARVLPWTDIFLPNIDEARQLTGLDMPLEQARAFRDLGAEVVVITCGAAGALLAGKSITIQAGRFDVEFVDGTGSGDAFAAGFIDGMLDGCSAARCLERGSALGASCVRRAGATTGVFTRQELEAFLSRQRLTIQQLA